ncbi:MAG: hypothetical protein ACK4JY_03835 [Brevundimonas sp.]|uniref:hypothetical protein n=1 Tax=Brevundimonas sp. TaxID=1871086 RepID=UPI00391C6BD3
MPSPLNLPKNTSRLSSWLRRTLDELCARPDHLQRLSIIGSGFIMWPTMVGFALIVWLGYGPEQAAQSLNFMGMALIGSMALWGLVVVALLGIVKGLRVSGPGGLSVAIETTADDPDRDPSTKRVDVDVDHERRGAR